MGLDKKDLHEDKTNRTGGLLSMPRKEHNEKTWNNCGLDVLSVMLRHTGDERVQIIN